MATETPPCDLGRPAPDFSLPGVDGRTWTLAEIRGRNGTLVMFLCNHCPYVKAVVGRLVEDVTALAGHGVGAVAIMANDTVAYPEDNFEAMKRFAARHHFPFPYLIDESQDVARAYGAVCTPDFFGFDASLSLRYRGRLDSGRLESPPTGAPRELRAAMIAIAGGNQPPAAQNPSLGCSIKWRT
jgi:peroxiredoxin